MTNFSYNIPLILTFSRLIFSFTLVPFLLITVLPLDSLYNNCLVALFFGIISLTDFFDGYLARSYNQVTDLGKLLDPLADKFMLYATLVTLIYLHKVYFYWGILFIGREFFVVGLREIALYYRFNIAVVKTAKYKTAAQMLYMIIAIVNIDNYIVTIFQNSMLLVALYLSFFSAFDYYCFFIKKVPLNILKKY